MVELKTITNFLDKLLESKSFMDASLNGLQVDSGRVEVSHVAVAVDSGLSVIQKACELKADLILVHHGLFWGDSQPLTGPLGKKVALLMNNSCSLYASHLPLDAHLEYGNAAQLAKILFLQSIEPFCQYKGKFIGVRGDFKSEMKINEIVDLCSSLVGATSPTILAFGKKLIKKVGIVTGSGAFALAPTFESELDLLISGEPKHGAYHEAKELGLNAVFAGHYATETLGVRALGELLKDKFSLKFTFIHEGSGI